MVERKVGEKGDRSSRDRSGYYNSGVGVNGIMRDEAESFEICHETEPAMAVSSNQPTPSCIVMPTSGAVIPHQSAQMVEPVSHHKEFQYTYQSGRSHCKIGGGLHDRGSPYICKFDYIGVQNKGADAACERDGNEVPPIHIPEGAIMALPAFHAHCGKQETSNIVKTSNIQQRNTRTIYPGRAISSPFDGGKTDMEQNITHMEEKIVQYIFDRRPQAK